MDNQKRDRILALLRKAEHLSEFREFMDGFLEAEKQKAAEDLLTNRDPALVKADLLAAHRIYDYFSSFLKRAKLKEDELKHGT